METSAKENKFQKIRRGCAQRCSGRAHRDLQNNKFPETWARVRPFCTAVAPLKTLKQGILQKVERGCDNFGPRARSSKRRNMRFMQKVERGCVPVWRGRAFRGPEKFFLHQLRYYSFLPLSTSPNLKPKTAAAPLLPLLPPSHTTKTLHCYTSLVFSISFPSIFAPLSPISPPNSTPRIFAGYRTYEEEKWRQYWAMHPPPPPPDQF